MLSQSDSQPKTEPNRLQTPVQFVPGVGPGRAELLHKLNIRSAFDLLYHLPHSFHDFSNVRTVPHLEADVEQSVHGVVVERDSRKLTNGRSLVGILLDCSGHFVRGTWFNQPWMFKKFNDGDRVVFRGKPKRRSGRWEFSNPHLHFPTADDDDLTSATGVLPRYSLTEGISMGQMRRMTAGVVKYCTPELIDPLPERFRSDHKLSGLVESLQGVHCPRSVQDFRQGRHRLILDDLLEFQLGLAIRRRLWSHTSKARAIPTPSVVDARIRRLFSFRFTDGQNAAVADIVDDLNNTHAMHRLLQADVGAGKTAVAVYAMLAAVAAGFQTVLMAPTEVLATQHWQTFEELLSHSRVKRGFLVGGLPTASKRKLLAEIADGECQLIIGTQAVIQDGVQFQNLALAVIDEQHRFGVRQRSRFGSESESPHVLVMTATPIPRSLCLTRFGDLDVSLIREMPPGRQKVVTSRVSDSVNQAKAWNFVRQQIQKGRQIYVVCPRVEGQDEDDDAAAESVYRQLSSSELSGLRVELLHGRMDRDKRREVMDRFRHHESDVLVSTTVIEVGVDVPNATIMVIRQAERFGLAQLHQLRGRIGRGRFQGYCFLFSDGDSPDALARINALVESSDGFILAEKDAELRGPGDVLGTRQSGVLPLRVANPVRDISILTVARRMAFDLVRTGEFDGSDYAALKSLVLERFADVLDLPRTG
ncbi:MAG: ATP-dependent DNA helicase RecG [Fuerstiella sp.]|nr:ATP-dependent DNA helicase RecG [Fuerstiella sp.]